MMAPPAATATTGPQGPTSGPLVITALGNLDGIGQTSICFRIYKPSLDQIITCATTGISDIEVLDFILYRNHHHHSLSVPPSSSTLSSTSSVILDASSTSISTSPSFFGNLLNPFIYRTSIAHLPPNKPTRVPLVLRDVCGQNGYQRSFDGLATGSDAIIFVVDAASHEQGYNRSTSELFSRFMYGPGVEGKHVLIFANKMDRTDAMTVKEVRDLLGLERFERHAQRSREEERKNPRFKRCCAPHWMLIGCSAKTGEGIQEGMDWLIAHALERRRQLGFQAP